MTDGPQDGTRTRIPASTYRVQVTAEQDLHEVARRLAYVHDLGADWVYLSPVLQAAAGSTHGYDVVDTTRVDASRGGPEGLRAVADAAHRLGMGVLVDIVPNHMGVASAPENAWWWDLLRHGPGSSYADTFDVDWDFGGGRIRLPVLGDDDLPHEDRGIGHLTVEGDELRYHDHRFPIAPGSGDGSPDEVHARQHYELVGWRRGDAELNYRRFFTVTTLAGVRVEVPEVFAESHIEVRRWFDEDLVDGLRIDHPDGLQDPEGYLEFLLGLTGGAYTLVEKILEPGEELPRGWAMDGTTGYDVMALLDRVLVDPAGQEPLDALETRLRGGDVDWAELVHDRKRAVADGSLFAETRRVVRELPDLLPHPADVLEDAVAEVLACFPVYRSYLPLGREHLDHALAEARRRRPDLDGVLDDLSWCLADAEGPTAKRFQQTSGMVMAKGVEDCAFYRWSRLTSLNEVGADPSVFSVSPADFHAAMATRQDEWPHAMTALSTHDTKRSEDTRARITAIAEDPAAWADGLERLHEAAPVPDRGFANLLWQAAVGAWPVSRERLHAYAEKAMREAGDHTSWTDPDEEFESAVHRAIDEVPEELLAELAGHYRAAGDSNSLALKLLGLTVPGVPDVYQGTELGDLSLVDPDNRRPVDFDAATASLASGDNAKQALTAEALRLRRDRPELFTGYAPVAAEGPAADHVLAFDRGGVVTAVTRLPLGLAAKGGWGDTVLHLPGGDRRVEDVLGDRPAALVVQG